MTINGNSAVFSAWLIRALLGMLLGILTWNGVREIGRNDKQDEKIQSVEKTLIKIDFIQETLNKIEKKVDKLSEQKYHD